MIDLDAAARGIAPAGDDDAPHQRALLDRPDEVLSRRLADGAVGTVSRSAGSASSTARLRVLAGAKALALVVEGDDDADRPRPGLGGGRDTVDPAGDVAGVALDADRRRLARLEQRDLVRADRAGELERRKVDDGDDLLLGADLLARHDVALADDAGDRHRERRLADADARRASCACADLSCARAASRRACEVCSAVGEMKFCAARPTLAVFWRSASTSVACADSTSAARSAARLCRSARSIAPITWPALTRLPSATLSESSVPAALARTTAVRGATSGPENSIVSGMRASTGRATSAATNSSGTALLALSLVGRRTASLRARTPAGDRATAISAGHDCPCPDPALRLVGAGRTVASNFAWPRV